jgi:4'-phosphopantetheinyl transferase
MDDHTLHPTFCPAAPGAAPLLEDEAHIWAVPLRGDPARFGELLSAAEQERVHRYRFADHQRRFQIGHGSLRTILGAYLDRDPRAIEFRHGPRGKPYLADDALFFNLSHSGKLALIAVARFELGLDLEKLRRLESLTKIAERHFSDAEYQALVGLDGDARELAFYRCWTRKEAYIKALGEGLSMALSSFDVSLGEEPAFLKSHDDREEPAQWSMLDVSPGPGFVGALAMRRRGVALQRFVCEA